MITYAANTTSEFEIGTVATHLCHSGFALIGNMNRTCVDDNQEDIVGVWSENAPACERIKDFLLIVLFHSIFEFSLIVV